MINLIGKDASLGLGFTPSQETLIGKIKEFLADDTKHIFTVKGAAGTGKTYVMRYILNNVIKTNCCVTAPTHKALRVIEKHTNKKGRTLQSLHGLRPNVNLENFNIDNVKFESLGVARIGNYKTIVCDECSMIGKDLEYLNRSRAIQHSVKIIYVGDPNQLPPVGERISRTFLNEDSYELTDIIRQDGDNPLLDILGMLRGDIDAGNTTNAINYLKSKPISIFNDKGDGYMTLRKDDFNNKVIELFGSDEFKKNLAYVRYTAWTNDNIKIWNKHIRKHVVPDYQDSFISVHDVFTGYKTIVDDYLKEIIVNSEDYIVNSIQPRIAEGGFNTFNVILQNVYTGGLTPVISIVNHEVESFKHYYNKLNLLHFNAIHSKVAEKGKNWKAYYEFKDRFLCMVNFDLYDSDKTKRATVSKDIDYGFGITAHKVQGSTYTNICVNLINMTQSKDGYPIRNTPNNPYAIEFMNKLLYVALSRATSKAIILI